MSNVLHEHGRIKHFQLPQSLIWNKHVCSLSGSALRLYVALTYLTHRLSKAHFLQSDSELRSLCGLSSGSLAKARKDLESAGYIRSKQGGKGHDYWICDPETRLPLTLGFRDDQLGQRNRSAQTGFRKRIKDLDARQRRSYFEHRMEQEDFSDRSRSQFNVPCPFHADEKPSFSVNVDAGVWTCHGACNTGGDMKEFEKRWSVCDDAGAIENIAEILDEPDLAGTSKSEPEAVYPYFDADYKLRFEILRYPGKEFQARSPKGNTHVYSTKNIKRMLYKLPAVKRAGEVLILEGEKDCDNAEQCNLTDAEGRAVAVTTNPFGAGKWLTDYNESLRGKRVRIIPDNDEPGREHAEHVLQSVRPFAASIEILRLPEDVNDVSDYLESYGEEPFRRLLNYHHVEEESLQEA